MQVKINRHVERLNKYLPFSPIHDQIYEEYQKDGDSLSLGTRALEYVMEALSMGARRIFLTGDAGHGKTHLCRRLVESYLGYEESEARRLINTCCDAEKPIPPKIPTSQSRPLSIVKDLSEFTVPVAARKLEALLAKPKETFVVCANEGRLRAVLEHSGTTEEAKKLRGHLRRALEDGLVTADGVCHVINLNLQSIATGGDQCIAGRALSEWLSGNRWRVCTDCDGKERCPIYHNVKMLSPRFSELAQRRLCRFYEVLAGIERLGAVVTIRDVLMLLAFVITGGLRCKDVGRRLGRGELGWQPAYAYYNLLFSPPPSIGEDQIARIPVLLHLRRVDPGKMALRAVDERIINEQVNLDVGKLDIQFGGGKQGQIIDAAKGIDEIIRNPRNRKERTEESQLVVSVVRALRRRAFFDDSDPVLERLGFGHGQSFLNTVAMNLSAPEETKLRTKLFAGLHAVQGMRVKSGSYLLLVDPAFGNSKTHSAIISRRVAPRNVRLTSPSSSLDTSSSSGTQMSDAVDWLERQVAMVIREGDTSAKCLLDLMTFDFLAKAAAGLVTDDFYAHDLRRLSNFLGRLADAASGDQDDISVVIGGSIRSVSIDEGGVIQVGGGQ